jgi:hypothetical protein
MNSNNPISSSKQILTINDPNHVWILEIDDGVMLGAWKLTIGLNPAYNRG